jgi:hypothetical protein
MQMQCLRVAPASCTSKGPRGPSRNATQHTKKGASRVDIHFHFPPGNTARLEAAL